MHDVEHNSKLFYFSCMGAHVAKTLLPTFSFYSDQTPDPQERIFISIRPAFDDRIHSTRYRFLQTT